jgi:hypothetical protein
LSPRKQLSGEAQSWKPVAPCELRKEELAFCWKELGAQKRIPLAKRRPLVVKIEADLPSKRSISG